MGLVSFFFALGYAIILTLLLITLYGSVKDWKSSWPLFVIILFGALAAGLWMIPVGPIAWGYHWLPGLLTSIVFGLLLAGILSGRGRKKVNSSKETEVRKFQNKIPTSYQKPPEAEFDKGTYHTNENVGSIVLSGFFWMLIVLLTFIVLAGLLMEPAY